MNSKRLFEGGETITTFTGQAGIVISEKAFETIRSSMKEGKRPGHYFAPGCCHHPDYVIQIPVLFEDGTYDVMRAMNIKKAPDLHEEKRSHLEGIINDQTGQPGSDQEERPLKNVQFRSRSRRMKILTTGIY